MAATQNYSLPLPQLGEPADIRVLDQGTEMIDGIMHGNRTMIAPGWVSTETYNTGNRVVYLGEYYKCKEDNVTGAWDATKWDKLTVGEDIEGLGTGGASALADLDDVEITSPTDGQVLMYNDTDDTWENGTLPDPSVVKEVTGNPVEFTDGAAAPLVKCVTEIQGSQDLHGYDKPWVGGAGKNKLPNGDFQSSFNVSNSIVTQVSDNHFKINGTVSGAHFIPFIANSQGKIPISLPSGTYTLSCSTQKIRCYIYRGADYTDAVSDLSHVTSENAPVTGVRFLVADTTFDNEDIYLQLELGSTSTTFAPYSNICPITAYTEGEIEVSDGDGNTTTHTTTYPSAIYRGSEDCVGGSVECEWTLDDMGDYTWTKDAQNRFAYIGLTNKIRKTTLTEPLAHAICSSYSVITPVQSATQNDGIAVDTAGNVFVYDSTKVNMSAAEFKTAIAGQGFAYELATPTTSSVTPTNLPIKSLSGYNHIESSTGDMEVEYITEGYQPLVDLIQSSSHVYSTAEQVVGKWIDGSTVYEKTISTSSPSTANTNVAIADLSSCSINTLISIEGVMYVSSLSQRVPIFWSYNTAIMGAVYVDGTNLMQIVPNGYTGATEVITIRYTKTTTRSLSAPVNTQKAQIEPLTTKDEEVRIEEENAVEMPETEEETDER